MSGDDDGFLCRSRQYANYVVAACRGDAEDRVGTNFTFYREVREGLVRPVKLEDRLGRLPVP